MCSHGDGVCLEGQCRCLKGWQPRDGVCKPLEVPVGAKCTNQEVVCQEDAVCDSGVCRCRYPGKCSPPVGRTQTLCSSDSDCKGGETCSNGKCLCPSEVKLKNKKKYSNLQTNDCSLSTSPVYKSLNSACWGTDRCAGGSVCKDSVCQCTDGSAEVYGRFVFICLYSKLLFDFLGVNNNLGDDAAPDRLAPLGLFVTSDCAAVWTAIL